MTTIKENPTNRSTRCAPYITDLSLNTLFTETKPPEDLLKEDKIKIVPITEVKGVQGNSIWFINIFTELIISLSCSYVDV